MKKRNDYSGEFDPELKLEDFSSDFTIRLVRLYSRLYIALDGFWYLALKARQGNDEALACDIDAWDKMAKYEMDKLSNELNIVGDDVVALVKTIQFSPWFQRMKYRIDLQGRHDAVLTITYCPTLNALEKEGEGREEQICNVVDRKLFKDLASFFNPRISVRSLETPPRKGKKEICCKWQFTLPD
jgi:hypothetical protein